MQIELSAAGREELAQSQQHERGVRNWKRYQAIRLLDQGHTPLEVSAALGCRKSSVYDWIGVWEQQDSPGGSCMKTTTSVVEDASSAGRGGGAVAAAGHRSAATGEEATTWTVLFLLTHLQQAGYLEEQLCLPVDSSPL